MENQNVSQKSRDIAVFGVLTALMVVFAPLPFVFLIPLITGSIMFGIRKALILSIIFGVVSLIFSFVFSSATFVSLAFVNFPFIPTLGRIAVGPAAALVYRLFKKRNAPLGIVLGGAAACITNTACVLLLMLTVAGKLDYKETTYFLYAPTMLLFGAIETVVAAGIMFPLMKALDKGLNKHFTISQNKQNRDNGLVLQDDQPKQ